MRLTGHPRTICNSGVAAALRHVPLKGEFVWHHHEKEDDLFFVMKDRLFIKLRDGEVRIGPGEFVVIPRGVDHLPVAEDEVHVILIEPKTTLNTGNVVGDKTVAHLEKI